MKHVDLGFWITSYSVMRVKLCPSGSAAAAAAAAAATVPAVTVRMRIGLDVLRSDHLVCDKLP